MINQLVFANVCMLVAEEDINETNILEASDS